MKASASIAVSAAAAATATSGTPTSSAGFGEPNPAAARRYACISLVRRRTFRGGGPCRGLVPGAVAVSAASASSSATSGLCSPGARSVACCGASASSRASRANAGTYRPRNKRGTSNGAGPGSRRAALPCASSAASPCASPVGGAPPCSAARSGGDLGADGLGVPVVRALNSVNTALGFEAGLVIVVLAIMLDRIFRRER